jgi:V/A-type H+-transporting ATPase subunit I
LSISKMLKIQLVGHVSIKEKLKRFLRERGIVEITEVSLDEKDERTGRPNHGDEMEGTLERTNDAIEFLSRFEEKMSLFARMGKGPLVATRRKIEELLNEVDIEDIHARCSELNSKIKSSRDGVEDSKELERSLRPWETLNIPIQSISTEYYILQFWTFTEKIAEDSLPEIEGKFPLTHFEECWRDGGKVYKCVIVSKENGQKLAEQLKEIGGFRGVFDGVEGTPSEIIEFERKKRIELEKEIRESKREAEKLTDIKDKLLLISDHLNERIGLEKVEDLLFHTDSTFVLEGWVRAAERVRLEGELQRHFEELEVMFREARDNENPPIHLDNGPAVKPYEFVTTLYGRPVYNEMDPTPLLAPFFVVFFAMCLTDAGYGFSLAALSAVVLYKFKPSGGTRLLMRLLFMGGVVTAVVGILAGGIFGLGVDSFPEGLKNFVLINPLEEPMQMLNLSFLLGLLHMLFGMGIKMYSKIKDGMLADAILDELVWIIFLIVLAPLGYSAILGGELPSGISLFSKRASLFLAAVVFFTGGRKKKGVVKKIFGGLVGFYDIVGYFGDVLSYARLLALGLATSAIAIAVNDIAKMVLGFPFYTGYIVMVIILIGGHLFNLAVNTLGAFVHSGRLQYLEFFSKFFTGGGRPFRPFRSERRYSVIKESKE